MRFARHRYAIAIGILVAGCSPDSKLPTDPGGAVIDNLRNWSDPATWPSGQVPAAGDSVVIPVGTSVRLDLSPPALHSLTIHGDLVFGDNDITLTTGWIVVTGNFVAGSQTSPYTHRALITLTGTPGDASILAMGNKMIGVLGRLELHGEGRRG